MKREFEEKKIMENSTRYQMPMRQAWFLIGIGVYHPRGGGGDPSGGGYTPPAAAAGILGRRGSPSRIGGGEDLSGRGGYTPATVAAGTGGVFPSRLPHISEFLWNVSVNAWHSHYFEETCRVRHSSEMNRNPLCRGQ